MYVITFVTFGKFEVAAYVNNKKSLAAFQGFSKYPVLLLLFSWLVRSWKSLELAKRSSSDDT